MRFPIVTCRRELVDLIGEIGFLPAFKNHIPGFSAEECLAPECWFPQEGDGFWEWKGPVIRESGCAYGKFLRGRACFISLPLYLEFANYRRDGYDFDALFEDGKARLEDKRVFDILWQENSLLSKQLKSRTASKGFDSVMTRLQMQGYALIADFEYLRTARGEPYGWGVARYETPEFRFGDAFAKNVYAHTPEQSKELLLSHLSKLLPDCGEASLLRLLG